MESCLTRKKEWLLSLNWNSSTGQIEIACLYSWWQEKQRTCEWRYFITNSKYVWHDVLIGLVAVSVIIWTVDLHWETSTVYEGNNLPVDSVVYYNR